VEVFTSNVGCLKDKQLRSTKNLKLHYLPAIEYFRTPLIETLYSELMKIPQDSVMHVHIAQAYVPEIVYKVWKKRKIPYIAQFHCDTEPSSFMGRLILEPYKKIFLKKFLKNAKIILALTEDYKTLIHKKYNINKNKIKVIPNGVRKEFFIKDKSENKIPHLLFVGRISIEKNIPKLIDAVTLCKSKFILDIVGEGYLLDETKKLVRERELGNVIFHGRKTGEDLIKIYKNSDIFILPSKKESFGMTLLEAMATRTPIIASNTLGIKSVIKNKYNGILIEPTPEKIAEAIERLLKNSKLREILVKNGLNEVKKYSWDKIVEQTEQVYNKVLTEHNKSLKN
jgi:glycosyltransferase involved in cell wall biosynthesis